MTEEPTGNEPWTPAKITMTSATERAAFRKCRRQWFLQVVHRLTTQEDNLNFWLGELVHTGLEHYYRAVQANQDPATAHAHDPAEVGLDAYEEAYRKALDKARTGPLGVIWSTAKPMYEDLGQLGMDMIQGYFEREQANPIGDEVVEVEVRRFVPIKSPAGRTVGKLSVRTDLVVRRYGHLAAVDHKTASQHLSSAMLDIDDQLTAETYITWKQLGEFPEEAVYNSLAKKVPIPPEELKPYKDGTRKFSQRKDQPTTAAIYRETLADAGLDAADYAEILAHLEDREARDETPFFFREATFRTPGQMRSFEENLYQEFRDMVAVGKDPAKAYPNPSVFACPSCPVRQVCLALMDDSDAGELIRRNFYIGEPRY